MTISSGKKLGRYEIRSKLGAGGMGEVYLAQDTKLNSYLSRRSNASIQSVAVMPFVNASGNADLDYLSDGMTETLISGLSQLPNLNVKARSTVFRYKGQGNESADARQRA